MRYFNQGSETRGDRRSNQENCQGEEYDNKSKPNCIPEQGRHSAAGYAVSHMLTGANPVLSDRGKRKRTRPVDERSVDRRCYWSFRRGRDMDCEGF